MEWKASRVGSGQIGYGVVWCGAVRGVDVGVGVGVGVGSRNTRVCKRKTETGSE